MDRIPVEALEARRLYRIRSRNLVVGVWSPDAGGFIGIREKFGHEYPFTEYHYDVSASHGTVTHMEPTEHVLPEHIALEEGHSACQECREPDEWVRTPDWTRESGHPMGTWHHVDRALDADHEPRSAFFTNTELFEWLKPVHDAELATERRYAQ